MPSSPYTTCPTSKPGTTYPVPVINGSNQVQCFCPPGLQRKSGDKPATQFDNKTAKDTDYKNIWCEFPPGTYARK